MTEKIESPSPRSLSLRERIEALTRYARNGQVVHYRGDWGEFLLREDVLKVLAESERSPEPTTETLKALADEGIVDCDGELRWVFKPGQIEVSSRGGTDRMRLAGLLRQVRYVIDDLTRKVSEGAATPATPGAAPARRVREARRIGDERSIRETHE